MEKLFKASYGQQIFIHQLQNNSFNKLVPVEWFIISYWNSDVITFSAQLHANQKHGDTFE